MGYTYTGHSVLLRTVKSRRLVLVSEVWNLWVLVPV